jgi:hypothetical protein
LAPSRRPPKARVRLLLARYLELMKTTSIFEYWDYSSVIFDNVFKATDFVGLTLLSILILVASIFMLQRNSLRFGDAPWIRYVLRVRVGDVSDTLLLLLLLKASRTYLRKSLHSRVGRDDQDHCGGR